jgi:hypothetical protein
LGIWPVSILMAWMMLALPCWGQTDRVNLVGDPGQWTVGTDHAGAKINLANCSWSYTPGWLTFAAPYLDVFGAEAPEFADPDFIRAIAFRKPCTDLPYNARPQWEVPWHWLHAIYPGHGNNVKEMQRCAGLLRELVAAGGEPIPAARASPEQIRVERFGDGGRAFLVLHNPADAPVAA